MRSLLVVSVSICLLLGAGCGNGGGSPLADDTSTTSASAAPTLPSLKFDFGGGNAATGFVPVAADVAYTPERGYGWTTAPDDIRDRQAPDALRGDFIFSRRPAVFRVDLAPGVYRMTVIFGDAQYGDHVLTVTVPESGIEFPKLDAEAAEFATLTAAFPVKGPFIDIQFGSPVNNWVVNALLFEPADAPAKPKVERKKTALAKDFPDRWQDVFAWPDPVAPYVAQFRKDQPKFTNFKPTGLTRADYLGLVEGNVDFFKNHQDANGAIIDPYKKVEYQYSTPCFALAAATIFVNDQRSDLLEPAAKALDWSISTLSQRKAATNHEDFYPPQIAHALPLLKPYVTKERYDNWIKTIQSFDPYVTYRSRCGHGNWNVVALSGEGLFYRMGIRQSPSYTEDCLASQGALFNLPWGMYTEGPMPYDHFPRIWAADMLAAGYQGKHTDKLAEVLRRGSLTSLFLQSPMGELPAGGRSAHHQWNEAEQCLTYEIYAAKAKADGDLELAGAFKRAAHLALGSMRRWQRPSGEMWIVKNRADPAQFLGYEGYSSHSQYNLLAMAMLCIAFEHAEKTDTVAERPAPADVGGFALHIEAPFNKIIANAGGMYIEIDHAADLAYNATGLLRVHRSNFNPQIGPSDALSDYEIYNHPTDTKTTTAIGPSWQDAQGTWRRLGEYGRFNHGEKFDRSPKAEVNIIEQTPARVSFEVVYTGDFQGPSAIVERYVVTPGEVVLTAELKNYAGPVRMTWPVLAFDGERETGITGSGRTVNVRLGNDTQSFEAIGASSVDVSAERYAYRNGWARVATAEYPVGQKAVLSIRPRQGP